jgi:hypothetical protein
MTEALHRISLLLAAFCLFLVGAYVFLKRRARTAGSD